MSRRVLARPFAAATLASALVLTPTTALADPGNGNGGGNGKGTAQAPGQQKDKPGKDDQGNAEKGKSGDAGKENAPGQTKGDGPATGKGQDGNGQGATADQPATQPQAPTGGTDAGDAGDNEGPGNGAGNGAGNGNGTGGGQDGDPAGNNGTVKIAALGDLDTIPNNTPHPGCTFQVEWYGFDEGEDVVSTVTFAAHAPTSDVVIGGTSPSEVFVGGDPASGAGTETGLDGRQAYTLSFDGEPHPKQGYHVKLTVSTPHSLGNDTKTKVFWVAPCEEEAATGGETTDEEAAVEGADDTQATGVLGTQLAAVSSPIASLTGLLTSPAAGSNARGVASDTSAVPTSVDAGAEGGLAAVADSPLALLLAGLLAAAAAVVVRRRAGA
jgi:hypothetical protein